MGIFADAFASKSVSSLDIFREIYGAPQSKSGARVILTLRLTYQQYLHVAALSVRVLRRFLCN